MQRVRNSDIDDVNVRPADYGAPVGDDFLPSPLRGDRFKLGLIAPADNFQFKLIRNFKKVADLAEGVGMRLGNEPRADHCDI